MKTRRDVLSVAAGLIALLILLGVVVEIFNLRLRRGDLHPPYSSLRSDPLGTRVLYESLEALPGIIVSRNFESIEKMPLDQPSTLLYLGDSLEMRPEYEWIDGYWVGRMNTFLRRGGRLVFVLAPRETTPFSTWDDEDSGVDDEDIEVKKNGEVQEAIKGDKTEPDDQSGDDETEPVSTEPKKIEPTHREQREKVWSEAGLVPVTNWLAMSYTNLALSTDTASLLSVERTNFPDSIVLRSSTIFTNLSAEWTVLYASTSGPVVIEREMGQGSIVLSAASFFVSNEGLRHHRHTELLTWLVGPHSTIIFDETHLGIEHTTNVAMLMRRYGLAWTAAGFALLAILFAWSSAYSLVPRTDRTSGETDSAFAAGRDSITGMSHLLRRHIKRSDLFAVCLKEWKRTTRITARQTAVLETLDPTLLAEGRLDPASAYNRFTRTLNEKGNTQP